MIFVFHWRWEQERMGNTAGGLLQNGAKPWRLDLEEKDVKICS